MFWTLVTAAAVSIAETEVEVLIAAVIEVVSNSTCGSVTAAANLHSYSPPPTFIDTPNNITAVVGSDVVLPCSIKNLGPKTIIWRKTTKKTPIAVGDYVFDPDKIYTVTEKDTFADPNNHRYVPEKTIKRMNLVVSGVNFEHAGTYQCVASTKKDLVRNVTLNVVDTSYFRPHSNPVLSTEDRHSRMKPRKTGISLTGTNYVEKGSSIDLNCTATAIDYRPKGLDWFKDGSRLKQGGRRLITDQYMGANVVHSRLEIERADMGDAGTYVCRFSHQHVRDIKVNVLNRTGTDGLELGKPRGSVRGDEYYGTVSRDTSQHRSDKDAGCMFSSSVALTLFLVLLALGST
ncbi:roundabout-like protein 1 [Elysia marginata]|uniref:Roundabout-like protein 1 n=1 Tax=Elysia marginata TaxID=1093978 RepID=A0AAV4F1I7_9GAST|nr:roundabout-like protein 1 [Elysia marginata]